MSYVSVDVLASGTARNTSSSSRFRYDAYRNRNDRKPCVNGSYACRGSLFCDSLSLSLKDFAGPSPPARLAGPCLPARLSGYDPHCWMCVHVVLCSGACLQIRLSACRQDSRSGACCDRPTLALSVASDLACSVDFFSPIFFEWNEPGTNLYRKFCIENSFVLIQIFSQL